VTGIQAGFAHVILVTPDIDTVFLQARELGSAADRAAYLDIACANDPERRARVEALLADAEAAESYFTSAGSRRVELTVPGEGPGTIIGRYQLLELIGEGGMGSVYLAGQHEPVDRQVALKIIKLGMDTREVVARFEAERQALATLDHPAIAKVLDGGSTEAGRPYFVMELVRGLPITQFCDEQHLTPAARMELFIEVCQAIQHAHQKGIIHRDIKPSNILVTLEGDGPAVKVIDFGIAKAIDRRLTEKTFFTQFREFMGTPAYMSPEQADPGIQAVDTRSDIYSLGVLLYELLTGNTPFENQTLIGAGLEEIRRILRETDPPKPSTRLNELAEDELTSVARARQVEPGRLGRFLRGDLDWIVMKALEKDRTRRYDTASGLAADVRRHLQGEAVTAAPPGAGYRVRKFARRHRAGLMTAALVGAAMLVGTGVSVWQAVAAIRANKAAQEERAEAEAITAFLIEVFRSPDPARDGRTITVAETLDRAARRLGADTTLPPQRRGRLLRTLGATATALGLTGEAVPILEKARENFPGGGSTDDPETLSVMLDLARAYFDAGSRTKAIALNEDVVRRRIALQGEDHPDTLTARSNLAIMYDAADRGEEALVMREDVWRRRERVLGPTHRDTLLAMNNLGVSLFGNGPRGKALALRERVLELSREHLGIEDLETIRATQALALSHHDAGLHAEALEGRLEVVRVREKLLGRDHSETLGALAELASSFAVASQFEKAHTLSEEVAMRCEKTLGPTHQYTLISLDNVAIALADLGRHEEALEKRRTLLARSQEALGKDALITLKTANLLASSYAATGRPTEALNLRKEVLELRKDRYPPDHPDTLIASEELAVSYTEAGLHSDALELRETVVEARRQHLPPGHPQRVHALQALAATLEALGETQRAAAAAEEARQSETRTPPPGR
jgi:tetratricopeptide (TPR) repeat protein